MLSIGNSQDTERAATLWGRKLTLRDIIHEESKCVRSLTLLLDFGIKYERKSLAVVIEEFN